MTSIHTSLFNTFFCYNGLEIIVYEKLWVWIVFETQVFYSQRHLGSSQLVWTLSPEEGSGNPLQYSCMENSMDREDWPGSVHGVTKNQTWQSDTCLSMQEIEEMRVQSLGWKISWRRAWQPTPVFLPGESYGQRSLVGYSP